MVDAGQLYSLADIHPLWVPPFPGPPWRWTHFPSAVGTDHRIPVQERFQDCFDLPVVAIRKNCIVGYARPIPPRPGPVPGGDPVLRLGRPVFEPVPGCQWKVKIPSFGVKNLAFPSERDSVFLFFFTRYLSRLILTVVACAETIHAGAGNHRTP